MPHPPPEPASPPQPPDLTRRQAVYVWLAGLFVTSLLIANLVGAKFFDFGAIPFFGRSIPIEHSVGMFAFPITFLLTDLVNEYYGSRGARRITWLGLGMSLFAALLLYLARIAPEAPPARTFVPEEMFDRVFSSGAWMIAASLTAYMVGQVTDIFLFGVLKRLTRGRMIWLRATGSTVVSQFVDSLAISFILVVMQPLASGERASLDFMIKTALTGYTLKFLIAVGVTPVLYLGHAFLRRVLGLVPIPVRAAP